MSARKQDLCVTNFVTIACDLRLQLRTPPEPCPMQGVGRKKILESCWRCSSHKPDTMPSWVPGLALIEVVNLCLGSTSSSSTLGFHTQTLPHRGEKMPTQRRPCFLVLYVPIVFNTGAFGHISPATSEVEQPKDRLTNSFFDLTSLGSIIFSPQNSFGEDHVEGWTGRKLPPLAFLFCPTFNRLVTLSGAPPLQF